MAGHSKWKQIKHYKAATDAKRGALFTKLIREITMAAKLGGGDPGGNRAAAHSRSRRRRAKSMPKENIERAIKKGTGELEGVDYQEVTYEGYGPGGVALIIDAVTDNPTRTVAEVRHKMSRGGGNLGTPNSVVVDVREEGPDLRSTRRSTGRGRDAGSRARGGRRGLPARGRQSTSSRPTPTSFHAVKAALEAKRIDVDGGRDRDGAEEHGARRRARTRETLLKLLEALEELDDVQKVWANFDIDDAELAKPLDAREAAHVIVLGIDPGTADTGYGVVRGGGAASPSLVECGVIRTRRARSAAGAAARDPRRRRTS